MEIKREFRPSPNLKLMDQVLQVLRYHHYAYRTEKTYCVGKQGLEYRKLISEVSGRENDFLEEIKYGMILGSDKFVE